MSQVRQVVRTSRRRVSGYVRDGSRPRRGEPGPGRRGSVGATPQRAPGESRRHPLPRRSSAPQSTIVGQEWARLRARELRTRSGPARCGATRSRAVVLTGNERTVVPRRASGTYHGGFPGASSDAVGGVITFTATDTLRIGDGQVVEYRPTPRACSSSSNWAFGKRPAERDPPARRADDFRPAGPPAGSPGWEDAPAGPDVIRGRDCPAGGTCSTHFDGTDSHHYGAARRRGPCLRIRRRLARGRSPRRSFPADRRCRWGRARAGGWPRRRCQRRP